MSDIRDLMDWTPAQLRRRVLDLESDLRTVRDIRNENAEHRWEDIERLIADREELHRKYDALEKRHYEALLGKALRSP